jgi:transposase
MSWTVAIGVDTHTDTHTASARDRLGRPLGRIEVAATNGGYLELLEWAESLGEPAFAVEGTACYGAGLTRLLLGAGRPVYEVARPERTQRRAGKSDALDADRAAQRLLSGEGLAVVRGGGERESLRALLVERRGARQAHTAALNQLHGLIVTAPARLRERLADRHGQQLVGACRRLRAGSDPGEQRLVEIIRRLAGRINQLEHELRLVDQTLTEIVAELAPELLAEHGVGPFVAAQLLVSAGDPRRLRSDASLARLAGVSPIPASSGKTVRHRLNRGGDRQLNYALHVIALHRIRHHDETRAYYQRLQQRGKSNREAIRCIKRALARRLYRLLSANPKLAYAAP